jgi:hypothetical protein
MAFKIKKRPEGTGGTGIGNGLTWDGILADAATGYGKRMPKQIQVAGHEARVQACRQGDDNSALLCRLKRSEGGLPHLRKRVEDDKQSSRWQTNLLPRCRSWNSARLKVCHLYWQISNRLNRQAVDNVEVWMTRIGEERKEAKNEV